MSILVEAFRPDIDPFFGLTEGWHVECEDGRFNPGEEFQSEWGEVVFNEDGYRTEFRIVRDEEGEGENANESRPKELPERFWVRCSDLKTQVHMSKVRPLHLFAAGPGRELETKRRNQFLAAHLSSSFRQSQQYGQQEEGSLPRFKKSVLRIYVGSALFFSNLDWDSMVREEEETLELCISFKDATPIKVLAKGRSRRIAPMHEFTTYSLDLGVSLVKISDDYYRVIHADENGDGYAEGVREGDVMVGSPEAPPGPRRWRRMEIRQVDFDTTCEFDFENDEDEDVNGTEGGATSQQVLTFSLRIVRAITLAGSDSTLEVLHDIFSTGSDVELNQGLGSTQWSFNCEATNLQVSNVNELTTSYMRMLDIELSLAHVPILPSAVMSLRLTLRGSFGLSLAQMREEDGTRMHTDVALTSFRNVFTQCEMYADGGMFLESEMKSFQIDDQQLNAPFPVVIFPTPVFDDSDEDLPAFKALISMRAPDLALLSIRRLEVFLAETTMRIHESFLISLLDFAASLRKQLSAFESEVSESSSRDGEQRNNDRHSPLSVQATPAPSSQRRVYVEEADLKPMRFNITFTSASSAAEKRLPVQYRQMPVISALITAVAAISDAPLRLRAVRIERESKTMDALVANLVRHYSGEIIRGLLAVAGSTDLLGSPVNLLGSVSEGAFSFFYEPALALSLGYGKVGQGFKKGGTALLNRGAGGLLESLAKMSSAVARALAQTSADQHFTMILAQQLKVDSYAEPINPLEGIGSGLMIILRSILDAIVGLSPRTQRHAFRRLQGSPVVRKIIRPLVALLLKPSAGFFAAVNQFSRGVRNYLLAREHPQTTSFPRRLPRPCEPSILPYSASRSAGYLLARHRFGRGVQYIFSQICQLEILLGGGHHPVDRHLIVATVVITDTWVVACRETLLDIWAIPLDMIEKLRIKSDRKVVFECFGKEYVISGRNRSDAVALLRAFKFVSNLQDEQASLDEPLFTAVTNAEGTVKGPLKAAMLWDMRSLSRAGSLKQLSITSQDESMVVVGGNELDIVGYRVRSGEIQNYGIWPDGIYRYQLRIVSVDLKAEWIVERRYSEFLRFRDRACEFLSISRKSIPLPGRRPWKLSPAEHEARWKGLQAMLDMVLKIDLLAESEVLREFLTRGADNIKISE